MPYLPLDPNEKVTATSGGTTSQPVAQTGVSSGGVGGGAGPQGGPKTNNSYTNLTNYLQANAGNTANADAVKSAVFDPLAQQLNDDNAYSANASEHRANLDTAVNGLRTSGGVQSALEQAYGNTYANQGNKALDAAISGRGVLDAAQRVSGDARPRGPAPSVPGTSTTKTDNVVTPAGNGTTVTGKGLATGPTDTSGATSTSKTSDWRDPSADNGTLQNNGRTGAFWTAPAASTPASGGAPHHAVTDEDPRATTIYRSSGGLIPQSGGHYENLMNKIKGKC